MKEMLVYKLVKHALELLKKGYKVSTFDPRIKNFNLIDKRNVDVILMLCMAGMEKMESHKVILNI